SGAIAGFIGNGIRNPVPFLKALLEEQRHWIPGSAAMEPRRPRNDESRLATVLNDDDQCAPAAFCGNAYTIKSSPGLVPSPPWPPAAIATYCLPSARYVIGVAWPPAGRRACHSRLPVRSSKARVKSSDVAPMKIRPPAVIMLPPMLNTPVCIGRLNGICHGPLSRVVPSGRSHTILRVTRSIATSCPHGGGLHGIHHGFIHGSTLPTYGVPYMGARPPLVLGGAWLRSVHGFTQPFCSAFSRGI